MRFDNGYYRSSEWRAIRKRILQRDPVCTVPGCGRPSTHAEHLTSRANGGTNHDSNLTGRCASCANRKTAKHDGAYGNPRSTGDVRAKGCHPDGSPRDPKHPWAKA